MIQKGIVNIFFIKISFKGTGSTFDIFSWIDLGRIFLCETIKKHVNKIYLGRVECRALT